MSEVKKLSIEQILENTPENLEVPSFGTVKVRCPTNKEKIDAKREANRIASGLSSEEVDIETTRILATKMLVEPSISIEDYLNANDSTISMVLDTVNIWYTLKLKALNDKRKGLVKSFLEQMKEPNQ